MTATSSVRIATGNEHQLEAWDGDEGAYWADHADAFDRSVAVHHRHLMDVAAIERHDQVLDVGCGSGQTTLDAAHLAPDGHAVGVDLSSRLLAVARSRAAAQSIGNATFLQADAQIHPFPPASFDVVLSRTAAMFLADLDAGFANLAGATRSGGRLAMATWQPFSENEWIAEISGALAAGRDLPSPPPDGPGPFALSDPHQIRDVLAGAGFTDVRSHPLVADMWFGDDAASAHRFVLGLMTWMLDDLDEDAQAHARRALLDAMTAHETADGVRFRSGCWITTAVRR